jgi:cyclohexadienyl dehydratase
MRQATPILTILFLALGFRPGTLLAVTTPAAPPALTQTSDRVAAVLDLVDARLQLMPAVAAVKWRSGQPIADSVREAAVIDSAAERAARAGLARSPIAKLFALQVRLAREFQESLHLEWRHDGFPADMPERSLAGDLRPEIDRLTGALLTSLYLAAPDLTNADTQPGVVALARTHLPSPRWNDDMRAELLSALAEVRYAAPRSLSRARSAGILRIGTAGDYAPFSVASEGRLTGADVTLALALAAALDLTPTFIASSWATLLPDLEADRFDIAVGGISITSARRAVAGFSLPTAHGGKTAVGRCTDRAPYATLDGIDQPGVRVIENRGGTNEIFARDLLKRANIRIHPDNRTVFDELLAGRADVMFTDDTEIALVTHRHSELCRLLHDLYAPAEKAFLLPREPEWSTAVNHWLAPQLERGEPDRLLREQISH